MPANPKKILVQSAVLLIGLPMLVQAADAVKPGAGNVLTSPPIGAPKAPLNPPPGSAGNPLIPPTNAVAPVGTITGIALNQDTVVAGGTLSGKLNGTGACQVAIGSDGTNAGPSAITIPNSPNDGLLPFPIPFSLVMTTTPGVYSINAFGPTGSGWKGCGGTVSTKIKVVPPGTMTGIILDQTTITAGGTLSGKLQGTGSCDVAVGSDGTSAGNSAITIPNSPSDPLPAFPIPFSLTMTVTPGTYHVHAFGSSGSGWKGCAGTADTTVTVVPPGTMTGIVLDRGTIVAGSTLTGKLLGSGNCDVAVSSDGTSAGNSAITIPNSPSDPLPAFPIPFGLVMTMTPGTYHINAFGSTGSGWKGCAGTAATTVKVVAGEVKQNPPLLK